MNKKAKILKIFLLVKTVITKIAKTFVERCDLSFANIIAVILIIIIIAFLILSLCILIMHKKIKKIE